MSEARVPSWLRSVGVSAWLLVGVVLAVVAAVGILSLASTIVGPVIAASVIAAVAAPLVAWLERHRVPRLLGTILFLLAMIALSVLVVVVVLAGIKSQSGDIGAHLSDAKDTLEGWLKDAGVDASDASQAKEDASSSATDSVSALLEGLGAGISALSGLVFFLGLTLLCLIFLLSDGPKIRAWCERHMGVPRPVAHTVVDRVIGSLRGYFMGVTIVAAFNAAVVGVGALLLGVPLAGTIAAITFFAAYVPYLGAWTAAAFSVLLALGGAGTDAAAGMIVIQLLANSILQQLVQPIAMGSALGIHPLAVLIATIGGGALFGAPGLILAAPLTSAVVRIAADLAQTPAENPSGPAASPVPASP